VEDIAQRQREPCSTNVQGEFRERPQLSEDRRQDDSALLDRGADPGCGTGHHFVADGTVEWHSLGGDTQTARAAAGEHEPAEGLVRPRYPGRGVGADACRVSYLSRCGHTLSVALNFGECSTVGVASNESPWIPVRGAFEVAQ
jgi:hypothetical protein